MSDSMPGARVLDENWGLEHMAIAIPKGREQGRPFVGSFVQEVQTSGLLERIQQEAGLRGAIKAQPESGMRLGWGRDDGPFFFSCPGRKPHERCEPGPILLCMGLFSRFCVWAPRCTAHSVSKTRVNALMRRCAASGTRDRWCFALTANRSNSNASCSSCTYAVTELGCRWR